MKSKLASLIALSALSIASLFDNSRSERANRIKSNEPKTYKPHVERDLYAKKRHKKKIKARHKKKGHGRQ